MEIDTNSNFDLPDDHPTVQELTEQERELYRSALKASSEVVEAVKEYQEQQDKIDLEDPELRKKSDKIQTAIALSEVLEEIAAWRRNGIMADIEAEAFSLGTEFESIDSRAEDEKDE